MLLYDDQSNAYSHAGPGAKRRRERLTLDTIPKKIVKRKPYKHGKPTSDKNAEGRIKVTEESVLDEGRLERYRREAKQDQSKHRRGR